MNARVLLTRTIHSTALALEPVAQRLCRAVAQAKVVKRGRASQLVSEPVNQWDDAEEWS